MTDQSTLLREYERDSIVDTIRELRTTLRNLDSFDDDLAVAVSDALALLQVEDVLEN